MRWLRFLAFAMLVGACSPSSSPATTPPSVATTAPTSTLAVTTTVDRLAEIEAIYQDIAQGRLDALYSGDEEAFRALHVDNGYLEESMQLFDELSFDAPPSIVVDVLEVVHDGAECIAFEEMAFRVDLELSSEPSITVLELRNGVWVLSFAGRGWACDGPHPYNS